MELANSTRVVLLDCTLQLQPFQWTQPPLLHPIHRLLPPLVVIVCWMNLDVQPAGCKRCKRMTRKSQRWANAAIEACLNYDWLVVDLPLWKIWVRQLGRIIPNIWKIKHLWNHQMILFVVTVGTGSWRQFRNGSPENRNRPDFRGRFPKNIKKQNRTRKLGFKKTSRSKSS